MRIPLQKISSMDATCSRKIGHSHCPKNRYHECSRPGTSCTRPVGDAKRLLPFGVQKRLSPWPQAEPPFNPREANSRKTLVSDSTVSAYPSKLVGIGLDSRQDIFFLCNQLFIFLRQEFTSSYDRFKKSTNPVRLTQMMDINALCVRFCPYAPPVCSTSRAKPAGTTPTSSPARQQAPVKRLIRIKHRLARMIRGD